MKPALRISLAVCGTLALLPILAIAFVCIWRPNAHQQLYLVPMSPPASPSLESLAAYFGKKYDIPIVVLPELTIEDSAVDRSRGQVVVEELIAQVRRAHPKILFETSGTYIAITRFDMYHRGRDWNWCFTYRDADLKVAVLSTARLDPVWHGLRQNTRLYEARLRKAMARDIGFAYFGRCPSLNRRSPLFWSIWSIKELDRVNEEL